VGSDLSSLTDELRPGVPDADRIRAAEALGMVGSSEALRILVESVRQPYSSDYSAAVVRAPVAGGPQRTATLAELYRQSDDTAVRAHLKWAMQAARPRSDPPRADRLTQVNLNTYSLVCDGLIVLSAGAWIAWLVLYAVAYNSVGHGGLGGIPASAGLVVWTSLVASEVLALVLAGLLRRWGWFVLAFLLPISIPVFAIALRFEIRAAQRTRVQQASFEAALAAALADQDEPRS